MVWPDIFVTTLSLERYALYRATGRGGFEDASHATGVGRTTIQNSGWGTKFVDFDNDTRRDLFCGPGSRARHGFTRAPGIDYLQPPLMLRNTPLLRFRCIRVARLGLWPPGRRPRRCLRRCR